MFLARLERFGWRELGGLLIGRNGHFSGWWAGIRDRAHCMELASVLALKDWDRVGLAAYGWVASRPEYGYTQIATLSSCTFH